MRSVRLATFFLAVLAGLQGRAQTSETNERLAQALKRFPAADADKDGVLTMAEATAFRDKAQAKGGGRKGGAGDDATAPEGGKKYIYKNVGEAELPLYVYTPGHTPAEAKLPAIVFFFGGGWTSGSPSQFVHQCNYLADRGMVAITVEYRVSSRFPVKVEDCVEDAKSAMRWVRSHAVELGIDPDRIASGGGSAGGHLAACVDLIDDINAKTDDLKVSAQPNAMVLFNPAIAIAPNEALSDAYNTRMKQETNRTALPRGTLSPLTYAKSKQPPCIMFFGTADHLLEGAEAFCKQSVAAGNDCKIVTYKDQTHGFFNRGEYKDQTIAEMDAFLVKLGWLPAKPRE